MKILKNNTKWRIKMIKSSNKSTFLLKIKLHLAIDRNIKAHSMVHPTQYALKMSSGRFF